MKKSIKKLSALLLSALLCFAVLTFPGFAEQPRAEAVIPAVINVTGSTSGSSEVYTIRLAPEEGAPMPVPGEEYAELKVTEGVLGLFPPIVYCRTGIYRYTVSQLPGTDPNVRYDGSVYTVTVTVTNSEDGDRLETTIAIKRDGKKYDAAEFLNSRTPAAVITPRPGLIQTGQLKWPVPILCGAGIALIIPGIAVLSGRRRRKDV